MFALVVHLSWVWIWLLEESNPTKKSVETPKNIYIPTSWFSLLLWPRSETTNSPKYRETHFERFQFHSAKVAGNKLILAAVLSLLSCPHSVLEHPVETMKEGIECASVKFPIHWCKHDSLCLWTIHFLLSQIFLFLPSFCCKDEKFSSFPMNDSLWCSFTASVRGCIAHRRKTRNFLLVFQSDP